MSTTNVGLDGRGHLARRLSILFVGGLAVVILSAGVLRGDYAKFLIGSIAFNAITILSISILAGTSGIWSLGHTAFIAIGAYVAANMGAAGYPLEVILPTVICLSALVGYVLGISAGRFSILYFGLLTLAVALTTDEIVGRFSGFTGGDQGLTVAPMKSWIFGRLFTANEAPQVSVALATLAFLAADFVIKGAPGRQWRAVKSQRIASTAIGLTPYLANANALAFSAAIASVGGVATALTVGFLDPLIFDMRGGIMLIVGTVVGGIGAFLGAVVGAFFIVGIPELGRSFQDVAAFVLGASMILVLLVLPRGFAPTLQRWVVKPFVREHGPISTPEPGIPAAESISQLVRDLMPACDQPLRISNLSVAFGGLKVLENVSLDVPAGKTVGLIGPNGAGKTTLINVLSGFVTPSACDALSIGNTDLRKAAPQARLKQGIGRTFQHGELFDDLTIRETLYVAADRRFKASFNAKPGLSTAAIVERILDGLHLRHVAEAYPEELPFGVKKVADLARSLAAGARFVALDEPFSGLDRAEIAELRAILAGMKAAGVSILIIDHAVQEVLNITDHIVVLNFGTVLATGSPQEISDNVEVQKAYFGPTFAAKRAQLLHE